MQNADDHVVSVKAFDRWRMLRLPGGKRQRGVGRPLWVAGEMRWMGRYALRPQASVLSSKRRFCLVETSVSCHVARVCLQMGGLSGFCSQSSILGFIIRKASEARALKSGRWGVLMSALTWNWRRFLDSCPVMNGRLACVQM